MLPEETKWYIEKWKRGKVIDKDGKKRYWGCEHRMRSRCITRRPDLMLKYTEKKTLLLTDMACPNEDNKEHKREKVQEVPTIALRITRKKRVLPLK